MEKVQRLLNGQLVSLDAYMNSRVSFGDKVVLCLVAVIVALSIARMIEKWI